MRTVLGIDAAWTATEPSGVPLAKENESGWELVAAEPSYRHFVARAGGEDISRTRPAGSEPPIAGLLEACVALTGQRPDLVAIDMPLARSPIVRRRFADNAVSKAYGARKCGTHTPSATRPGNMSDFLTARLSAAGYPLATKAITPPCLIEVYPHPALIELMSAPERLPYKVAKMSKYWPNMSCTDRRRCLFANWSSIVDRLDRQIYGTAEHLRLPKVNAPKWALKSAEDLIDAAVCVWVGIAALDGHAQSFGDGDAAIWILQPPG